jgi:hypothetical protein
MHSSVANRLRQFTLWQRPALRARHVDIDSCIEHVIDYGTRGGSHAYPQGAEKERNDTGPAGYGHEHADDRREDDKHDDLGLGQLVVITPVCGLSYGPNVQVSTLSGLKSGNKHVAKCLEDWPVF